MKKLSAIAALMLFTPTAAFADSQAGYSHQRSCFRSEYREEYIPGTEGDQMVTIQHLQHIVGTLLSMRMWIQMIVQKELLQVDYLVVV